MIRIFQLLIIPLFLLALILPFPASSAPVVSKWTIGGVTYEFHPKARQLLVQFNGFAFEPLHNFGPVFEVAKKNLSPLQYQAVLLSARMERMETGGSALKCQYVARIGDQQPEYTLTIQGILSGLRIQIDSSSENVRGVDPGEVDGIQEWRRYDLSRYAELYGQPWWPKTTYLPQPRLWMTANWRVDAGSGASWQAPDTRSQGTGPFPAALTVTYIPGLDGRVAPLHEVLSLRISQRLWRAVPKLRQLPSPYCKALAHSVYLDLWGGNSAQLSCLLHILEQVVKGPHNHPITHFLTILENWQTGGFDSLLPDSIWMPKYPPNPSVGSVQQLLDLCRQGKRIGRFGFRTNYMLLRDQSPSALAGLALHALDSKGKPVWYTRHDEWRRLAGRQEREIASLFAPNASFTDQVTSGGAPWAYADYSSGHPETMSNVLEAQQRLLTLIKTVQHGPVGSESLIEQPLIGQYADFGDYGIMDGYHRLTSPEYKLRRLQGMTAFYGMGLMYRFFEMPPFSLFSSGSSEYYHNVRWRDDYRATEILYGNGGYLFYYPDMPWDYLMTEVCLIGDLQRYYIEAPARIVLYWANGSWRTFKQMAENGFMPNTEPWNPQSKPFGRIMVRYANGFTIVVNRLPGPFTVHANHNAYVLTKSGWVAWSRDGRILAYSACAPGTNHRVDFLRDSIRRIKYVDPRGGMVDSVRNITLWRDGKVWMSVDTAKETAQIGGSLVSLKLP